MPIILNKNLYDIAKAEADIIYKKPSAFKSGWIQKRYQSLGGVYLDNNKPKNLKKWFAEKWEDVGNKEYPVLRPTRRINKTTPLTVKEIDSKNLKSQIKLKQIIKGDKNLPPFKKKMN